MMDWPSEHEINAVLRLDGAGRYDYAVKKIVDREELWGLSAGVGWALAADSDGNVLMPIWPAAKYAELCASGDWNGYLPKSIDLDVWIERWTPGLTLDKRLVAVFPTPADKGVRSAAKELQSSLEEELQEY